LSARAGNHGPRRMVLSHALLVAVVACETRMRAERRMAEDGDEGYADRAGD
jgi:hypothetical protein